LLDVDLDDGEIGFFIHADHGGIVADRLGIAHEVDLDLVGFVDDVIVGHDVALGIDDNAGAERALPHVLLRHAATLTTLAAKEAVKEILEGALSLALALALALSALTLIILILVLVIFVVWSLRLAATPVNGRVLECRLGVDVDHRRLNLFRDLRELVRKLFGFGNLQRCSVAACGGFFLTLRRG
jgi:hypothetical protein